MDRWERRWEQKAACVRPGRHLFSGFVFVAIGVLFLLGNMGMVDVGRILRFWPVLLIAAGVFRLIESGDNYGHSAGIFWIVIGGFFLLSSTGILRMAFHDLWPVILIGLGALMLWKSALGRQERWDFPRTPPAASSFTDAETTGTADPDTASAAGANWTSGPDASSNSVLSATAILGNVERRNNSQDFRGGSATAVMGRCEIDLRPAAITKPHQPVLEVFALWGGIEIRVPPDWTVVSQVDPVMGGYEDHTAPPKEESKRFLIRGSVIMGGIEVTN
jgi:predicted membrane protein